MKSKWTQERFEEAMQSGRTDFSHEDLSGLDLSGLYLQDFYFSGTNLSGADLSGTDLSNTDLSQANLNGANLRQANLSEVRLTRATLVGADLEGATLTDAYMEGVDLTRANLKGVTLTNAEIEDAQFPGRVRTLRGAAAATIRYLQECGWICDMWVDGTYGCCPACLHGAALLAGGPMGPTLSRYLSDAKYTTNWNDEVDRTMEEVLEPLRTIARGEELAPAFMS